MSDCFWRYLSAFMWEVGAVTPRSMGMPQVSLEREARRPGAAARSQERKPTSDRHRSWPSENHGQTPPPRRDLAASVQPSGPSIHYPWRPLACSELAVLTPDGMLY